MGVHALVEGKVGGVVGGFSSVAVKRDDERRLAVDKFQRRHQNRSVLSCGVVDVVDYASGILRQRDGPFEGGAIRHRPPIVLTLGPLLLRGEGRLRFAVDLLRFLRLRLRLRPENLLVPSGVFAATGTCKQSDGQQNAAIRRYRNPLAPIDAGTTIIFIGCSENSSALSGRFPVRTRSAP